MENWKVYATNNEAILCEHIYMCCLKSGLNAAVSISEFKISPQLTPTKNLGSTKTAMKNQVSLSSTDMLRMED